MSVYRLRAVAVGIAIAVTGVTTLPVEARSTAGATATPPGYDISYPQCSQAYPQKASFGVVGVNDGIAWSTNPCLASEYSWASSLAGAPGLYMNTANPAPSSKHYWPVSGSSDPALCKEATSTADPGCAYDYGWHTAAAAVGIAGSAISPGAATSATWWLDVETSNTWNGSTSANAADLQGSIDYLRSHGVATVGVYSTSYQWGQITGGYTVANSATYAQTWAPEFTSLYGIGASPDWVAGAGSARQAARYCGNSFTGVAVRLTQYPSGGFDADYRCP